MIVLVSHEESQEVCKAYREAGHTAFSNDLKECSGGHPEWHLQMDCYDAVRWMIAKYGRINIIILHPECTKVCVSGNPTYGTGHPKHAERIASARWIKSFWDFCVESADAVLMENPVGVLNSLEDFPKPYYIHPWQFGHMEQKRTGIWSVNLPKLEPTDNVYEEMMKLPYKDRAKVHNASPGPKRAEQRSKTFRGIAKAFASQLRPIIHSNPASLNLTTTI